MKRGSIIIIEVTQTRFVWPLREDGELMTVPEVVDLLGKVELSPGLVRTKVVNPYG